MAVILQPETDSASRIRYPVACLFSLSVAYWITRTARDALFLAGDGIFALPWGYLLIALGGLPAAWLTLASVRRLGLRRARLAVAFAVAVAQVGCAFSRAGPPPWAAALGFAAVPLAYGALLTLFWLLVAELRGQDSDGGSRAAAYGLGAILAGTAAGGIIARLLAPIMDPAVLLHIGAIALVATAGVLLRAYKRFPAASTPPARAVAHLPNPRSTLATLAGKQARSRFALALLAVSLTVLVEFQFYFHAAMAAMSPREASAYHALVNCSLGLVALGVFLLLRLLARFGAGGGAAIAHPLAVVVTAAVGPLASISISPAVMRVAEAGFRRARPRRAPASGQGGIAERFVVEGWARGLATLGAAITLASWLSLSVTPGRLVQADVSWIGPLILGGGLLLLGVTLLVEAPGKATVPTLQDVPIDGSALTCCCLRDAVPTLATNPDLRGAVQLGGRTVIPDPPR